MPKKLLTLVTSILVVFGMLSAAPAALADSHGGSKGEVNGSISIVGASTLTITPRAGGTDVVLNVDAGTSIRRDGAPVLLSGLLVGDKVEAKYDKTTMIAGRIEAKSPPVNLEVEGLIAALGASDLTISPKHGGANITVNVDATTTITRSGKPALLTELLVGDKVDAKYNKTSMLALTIKAKAQPLTREVKGIIAAVGTSTLTITPGNGTADITVNIDASTRIKRGGKPALLTDLLVGEKVEVKYNTLTLIASRIDDKAKVPNTKGELHGIVAAVDLTLGTVTITPSNGGADVTLTVNAGTTLQSGHQIITLADLAAGDKVEAKYDKLTLVASKLQIHH